LQKKELQQEMVVIGELNAKSRKILTDTKEHTEAYVEKMVEASKRRLLSSSERLRFKG
jgi:hypothetical protein